MDALTQIQRSGIVWRFDNTQEEAREDDPGVVLRDSREPADDCPTHHTDTHVPRWADPSDDHVTGNLESQVQS
jgi:hypothetical protein